MNNDLTSLYTARYGNATPAPLPDGGSAGVIFQTLLNHRSVRKFSPEPLPAGTLESIITAGQSAASSSNLQAWSVIALEDPAHKAEAARLCGDQDFIRQAPLFLVFCADLSRLTDVAAGAGETDTGLEYTEMFLIAVIDATLAAQNVAIAAESLGLGLCYVGAARNHPVELAALLGLPKRVVALFGMAIGVPEVEPLPVTDIKPRLPLNEILHREVYHSEERGEHIARYDKIMERFYAAQGMANQRAWSAHSARRISSIKSLAGRHTLRDILQTERGFELR